MKTIYFGAGCFWGAEYHFQKINGIISTRVGFMGGTVGNPNYENCYDYTEVVELTYDESFVSYDEILDNFWKIHDPTSDEMLESEQRIKENKKRKLDLDVSNESRYRSIIFYMNEDEKERAKKAINDLNEMEIFEREITTSVIKVSKFYPASDYHQKYFERKYIKKRKRHLIFRISIIVITFIILTLIKLYLN